MSVRLCVNSKNQLVLEKNGNQKIIPTHVELPTAACGYVGINQGSLHWVNDRYINGSMENQKGQTRINVSQP